jgi:glyoxylase-like metal-dependent hydrolase (beta-lactamase superfamily II)
VAEGATVVTAAGNKAYYEKAFAAPKTLNPDRLQQARRVAIVEGVSGKRVLSDATRSVELHVVPIPGHTDEMIVVYLPKEKILIEADAYTPAAAPAPGRGAAAPAAPAAPAPPPNPFTVALYDHVQRLQLDVAQIAALHGPRLVTLADLRATIGR